LSAKIDSQFEEIESEVHKGFVLPHANIEDLSSQFEKMSLTNKYKEIPCSLLFTHPVPIHSI